MLAVHNVPGKKKSAEKALIPLPPTGFASVFFANQDVVQMRLQTKRALGLCGPDVIHSV